MVYKKHHLYTEINGHFNSYHTKVHIHLLENYRIVCACHIHITIHIRTNT